MTKSRIYRVNEMGEEVPTVPGVPSEDGTTLTIEVCPYCGQTHRHGAGYGHRIAHCASPTPPNRGYIIVEGDHATT